MCIYCASHALGNIFKYQHMYPCKVSPNCFIQMEKVEQDRWNNFTEVGQVIDNRSTTEPRQPVLARLSIHN